MVRIQEALPVARSQGPPSIRTSAIPRVPFPTTANSMVPEYVWLPNVAWLPDATRTAIPTVPARATVWVCGGGLDSPALLESETCTTVCNGRRYMLTEVLPAGMVKDPPVWRP